MVFALGLKKAIMMFLFKQDSIGVDLQNDFDSEDEYDQTPLPWAALNRPKAMVQRYGFDSIAFLDAGSLVLSRERLACQRTFRFSAK